MIGQLFREGTQRGCSWTHVTWRFSDGLLGAASCVWGARVRHDRRRRCTSRLHDEGCPTRDGFMQRSGNGREELVGIIGLLKEGNGAEGHGSAPQARLRGG